MRITKSFQLCLLVLLALPLLAPTCVKEKTIELTYKGSSETTFHATGSTNVDLGSSTYDVLTDLDIENAFVENDIDPTQVLYLSMRALYYKIETPDPVATRQIAGADMTVQFTGRPAATLVSGFSAPAGAATDWIDVTSQLNSAGVSEINEFLARVKDYVRSGYAVAASPTEATFDWSGTSTPTDQPTDFYWKAKMEVTVVYPLTADLPDF